MVPTEWLFKAAELAFMAGGAFAAVRLGGKVLETKVSGLEVLLKTHVDAINQRISDLIRVK